MMVMLEMISGPFQTIVFTEESRRTQSRFVRAERRVVSFSTAIYRRNQDYKYILGCNGGIQYRRLLKR